MKIKIAKYSDLPPLMSKAAGACFSPKVPSRTIQSWSEKGLINPYSDTSGTGTRRQYNFINLIEIGIIRSLTEQRLKLDTIKTVLDFLRDKGGVTQTIAEQEGKGMDVVFKFPTGGVDWEKTDHDPDFKKRYEQEKNHSQLEGLLARDEGYLIIHFKGDPPTADIRTFRIDRDEKDYSPTCIYGVWMLTDEHAEKTIILNITKIVKNVIGAVT